MSGHPDMNEREIPLSEMLDSREQRALMQKKLIAEFKKPLLCFTMNIAGPIKSSELIRQGFRYGDKCIVDTFKSENIEIVYRKLFYNPVTRLLYRTTGEKKQNNKFSSTSYI